MKKNGKFKKLFGCMMSLFLIFTLLSGCSEDLYDDYEDYEDYEGEYEEGDGTDYSLLSPDGVSMNKVLTVDKNTGEMTINRPKHDPEVPMGEDGTWTIFVYLCGSDLESDGGAATDDLAEMQSASTGDNVRFVVETGGASSWSNEYASADALHRFVIQNEEIEEVATVDNMSMGDTATLTDFLRWGVKEYPAEHMGVVFWNHGGGSITGVCYDENFDSDSLSLIEIDSAFYSIFDEMTDRFEFVGFDACLMGTVETANVLANYSCYMIGSEELEPGSGWDYTAIGNFLANNPDATGEALGKEVCDSYLAACEAIDDSAEATLAVINLEKVDDLLVAFNSFAKSMYESGDNAESLSGMIREIRYTENFGGNDKSEGFTNMVDLGGLAEACSSFTSGSDDVKNALAQAVAYKVSGGNHETAGGLAMYYPLQVGGSQELAFFETISISPYYISFIDRQNLGASYAGSAGGDEEDYSGEEYDEGYDEDSEGDYDEDSGSYWYDEDGWYDDSYYYDDDDNWSSGCEYEYDESAGCYRSKTPSKTHWEYADNIKETGESKLVRFASEPAIDDEGIYGFSLTSKSLENVAAVYATVYQVSDDGKDYIELGETFDVDADWDKGTFRDYFDGYWMSLPDGQNLATYVVDYDEDFIVYTSPILLNGKETNLRIRQDAEGNVTIEGAWDGIGENGAAARSVVKLKDGDVIIPRYYSLDAETEEEGEWQGSEYKIEGTPEIVYGLLAEADFLYAFIIDDIYYDYYMTDFVAFNVDENGQTSFYAE